MEDFVNRIREELRQLNVLGGEPIPDREMFDFFIFGIINKDFNEAKRVTLKWKKEKKTFEHVAVYMINEECAVLPFLAIISHNTMIKDESTQKIPDARTLAMNMFGKTCYYCGKPNHIAGSNEKPICRVKIADRKKGIFRRCIPGVMQPGNQKSDERKSDGQKTDGSAHLMHFLGTQSGNTSSASSNNTNNKTIINPTFDRFAFFMTMKKSRGSQARKSLHFTIYVDSGATEHMFRTKEFFTNYKSMVRTIATGREGDVITTEGVGDVTIQTADAKIVLKNAWYSPQLSENLISVA